MSEQYKHDKERDVQFEKLHQLKYDGNIFEYINRIEALNMRVGLSGFGWRKAIKRGLSQELRRQLAQVPGGEPREDDALISKLKVIGYAHEEYLAEEKAMGHSVAGVRSNEKAKSKKRKRGDATEAADTTSAPAAKKQQRAKVPPQPRATRRALRPDSRRTKWRMPLRVFNKTFARPETRRISAAAAASRDTDGNGAKKRLLSLRHARPKGRSPRPKRRIPTRRRRLLHRQRVQSNSSGIPLITRYVLEITLCHVLKELPLTYDGRPVVLSFSARPRRKLPTNRVGFGRRTRRRMIRLEIGDCWEMGFSFVCFCLMFCFQSVLFFMFEFNEVMILKIKFANFA